MQKWQVEADGVTHQIQFQRKLTKNIINIDGETYNVKSSNMFINLLDYGISFGTTDCNLVVLGKKGDLAVNGVFLGSKEPYEPVGNMSSLIWVLVGISSIGGFILAGLLGLLIGILMSSAYITFGMKKKNGAAVGCFVACTLIQILVFFVVLSIRQ